MTVLSRLIVAADYDPDEVRGNEEAVEHVYRLADQLQGLDVILKVNSALREAGNSLIGKLHSLGCAVFADYKLYDISHTCMLDAKLLRKWQPDIVTVACNSGLESMRTVKQILGEQTEVLGVNVLSSNKESSEPYIRPIEDEVWNGAKKTIEAGLDGFVVPAREVQFIRKYPIFESLSRIGVGIRPGWATVLDDDQYKPVGVAESIEAGADRIVVGRPITQAKDPRDAVMRTLDEIHDAINAKVR